MTDTKKDERAEQQAKAQFESIRDMVKRLQHAEECDGDDCEATDKEIYDGLGMLYQGKRKSKVDDEMRRDYHDAEAVRERIREDALSVEIRSGWYTPGSDPEPEEYTILLCTGGPACRIIGDLGRYNEPETARIEYQDWFTPWQEYRLDSDEEATVLAYARQFYFGD